MAIWGSLISAGVGLLASDSNSDAIDQASSSQSAGSAAALAAQQRQFNQTRADNAPWLNTGKASLNRLSDLMGLDVPEGKQQIDWNQYLRDNPDVASDPFYGANPQRHYEDHGKYESWRTVPYKQNLDWGQYLKDNPDVASDPYFSQRPEEHYSLYGKAEGRAAPAAPAATPTTAAGAAKSGEFGSLLKPFSLADFEADPGYKFRQDQGLELLNRQLGAGGLLNSGNRLLETTKFGQNLASQEYGNAYNRYRLNNADIFDRLSSVSNMGQASANNMASLGQSNANSLSNLYTNNANNQASAAIAGGNSRTSAYEGIGDAISGGWNNYRLSQMFNQLPQQSPAPVWNRDRPYTG